MGLQKSQLSRMEHSKAANKLKVTIEQEEAGRVYIYALMNDGTIASDTIKKAIYDVCNDESVRPLTDYVSMHDPLIVEYDIDFTYYISRTSQLSLNDIQIAIEQCCKRVHSMAERKART